MILRQYIVIERHLSIFKDCAFYDLFSSGANALPLPVDFHIKSSSITSLSGTLEIPTCIEVFSKIGEIHC